MADPWLVVGLGNVGEEYARTRHNAGAMVSAILADRLGASFRKPRFVPLSVAEARHGDTPLLLTQPGSWMNTSGPAIASFAKRRSIPLERVVAVHDEIDLPFGALRIKKGGSTAGHHGLDSIVEGFRSPDFFRVRIGIGRPARREQNVDYMLTAFNRRQLEDLPSLLEDAADAVLTLIDEGMAKAQDRYTRSGLDKG